MTRASASYRPSPTNHRPHPASRALAWLCGAALAAGAATAVAADATLGFEQALARALERSPAMLAAAAGREVAAERLRGARAWQNPTLTIEAENVLGRGAFSGFDAAETTVFLAQPLPLGGARGAAVRAARAGGEIASVEARLAERGLRRDVAIAYAEAVAADRLAEVERERARIAAETRSAADKRLAAGLESEFERARLEVETSGMQAAARRAQAEAAARRRALAALWREDTVTEPLDAAWFDAAPRPAPPAAVDAAAGEHPLVARARLQLARAEAELDAARAARFPGVEANLGARRFADLPAGDNQAYVIGLSLPLPLWNRNGAAIAEARAARAATALDAERATRELAGERAMALAEFEAAALEVNALAGSGLPAATAAARLAQQGYDAGRLSLTERLRAERALSDQREQLERARLALRKAEAVRDALQ